MTDEERYTLEEARLELARQECMMHGHQFSVVSVIGLGPSLLKCDRCGDSWTINNPQEPE